jgi:glutathione S-transferase
MKMKLYCSLTSPYARKIRIAVRELDIVDQVEEVVVDAFNPSPEFLAANPLSKVPVLRTERGDCYPESGLILDFLAAHHPGMPALPDGEARWPALRRLQLAEGILDAAVARQLEKRRPEAYVYPPWLERQMDKIRRSLEVLETEAATLGKGIPDAIEIGAGVALSYLDFRIPEYRWRDTQPRLAAWHEGFAGRPSVKATMPPDTATAVVTRI